MDKTFSVLAADPAVEGLKKEGAMIECTVSADQIGDLNRRLVDAGIEVRALVPKRSLEEYFLSITEGASEVAPVASTRRAGGTGGEAHNPTADQERG